MTITPFKEAVKAPAGDKGLINVKSLYRRLKSIFGNFQVSGDGVELSETALGIHIKVKSSAGDGLWWAWQMKAASNGVNITPGVVLLQSPIYPTDSAVNNFTPVINGVSLLQAPAPTLPIATSGDTFVLMEVLIDKNGSPMGLPWAIKSYTTYPEAVPLVRPTDGRGGQDGVLYVPLAIFRDGVQTAQFWLGRPISVVWTYNTVLYS